MHYEHPPILSLHNKHCPCTSKYPVLQASHIPFIPLVEHCKQLEGHL